MGEETTLHSAVQQRRNVWAKIKSVKNQQKQETSILKPTSKITIRA